MNRQYTVLRIIAALFKIGGVLMLLVSLAGLAFSIGRLIAFFGGNSAWANWVQLTGGFLVALWAFVQFMLLYAVGESLNVLMAIEENTRASSMRLIRLISFLADEERTAG